jgi:hypothetical protein
MPEPKEDEPITQEEPEQAPAGGVKPLDDPPADPGGSTGH